MKLIQGKDWPSIADTLKQGIFSNDAKSRQKDLERLAGVYSIDSFDFADPICAVCGGKAYKRCSACKSEWYCTRECQVGHWKQHEPICKVRVEEKKRQVEKLKREVEEGNQKDGDGKEKVKFKGANSSSDQPLQPEPTPSTSSSNDTNSSTSSLVGSAKIQILDEMD